MSGNTPKTMSKGLMGMKFMQRAAAKSSPSSPATSNGPPAKKARLSHGASAVGTSDQEIIQSGLDAEEAKRQAALDKAAQHAGETKWVLSFQDPLKGKRQDAMQVRHAGYAEIDAQDDSEEEEEEEEEEDTRPVRMQFGGGVKKVDTSVPMVKTEDSESDSESSSDDYDSDDAAADLIRQTKREIASEKRESKKKRASMGNSTPNGTSTRQNENRSLNGLTSISGGRRSGGGGISGGSSRMDNVDCYKCGEKGHIAANCSNPSAPRGSAGRGYGKGRR